MRGFAVGSLVFAACSVPTGPAAQNIDVTFETAPEAVTNQVAAEFTFSAEGALLFTCSLDGEVQAACESPVSLTVTEGEHTFAVRALDVTRAASAPAEHAWLVDTVAPDLAIDGPTITSESSPEFTITSTTVPVALRCKLDDGAFEACASPFSPTLSDGAHTLAVEAEDAASNVTAASHVFTIDSQAPTVTITAPLIPARTSNPKPAVAFTTSDATNLTVTCAIDAGAFAICATGFASTAPLAEGQHTYHVRATDEAANTTTANATFTVDTTPPDLAITVTPPTPSTDTTPTFEFTVANQLNVGCALSTGELIVPCTSPVTFGPLTPGIRSFSVIASDDAVPANSVNRVSADFEITP